MTALHDKMADEGADLFMLTTSKSIVAHSLYKDLGYHDVKEMAWWSRKATRTRTKKGTRTIKRTRLPFRYDEIYEEFSKERTGFALRPKRFPSIKCIWHKFYGKTVTFMEEDEPVGYALLNEYPEGVGVRELACDDREFDYM